MPRTPIVPLAFAAVAMLVTLISAVFAYQGVRSAFEKTSARRLAQIAELAASQVSPADLDDLRLLGAEGTGFAVLETQLLPLRATAGLTALSLIDTTRRVLFDADDDTRFQEMSALDTLARDSLAVGLAGRASTCAYFTRAGERRAALVPIRDRGRVVGLVAGEIAPDWLAELEWLRRRLAFITLVSFVAIALLTALLVRVTGQQLSLERRLSRSENLAAMGRLSATLAHEIKNPLAIIRGSAKRLGRLEPEAQRMSDSVIEEVDRLTRTVGRYLQFARGETTPDGTSDVAAVLVATLDLIEGEVRSRQCTLVRAGDMSEARVTLDAESLKQVLLNLLLNALEASPPGGQVSASLERLGDRMVVRIRDQGPGLPAEVLAKLGEPFYTTKAQGTGLGLFLSRRLVDSAGGELSASAPPGGGAELVIQLPLAG
ncbi:MAG: ATP-binding protein [Candidatus Eisenbacteria bacterium]